MLQPRRRAFILAGMLWAGLIVSDGSAQPAPRLALPITDGTPRNLIFFIADGCGPATFSMARDFAAEELGRDQVFDAMHTGSVITRASDKRVTDSAASATAYACGILTRNGHLAVTDDGVPVPTLLEQAEEAGYWTGLVSTARITHATPAAFSSHIDDRDQEDSIAVQQIAKDIEVLFGGGRDHFLPDGQGGTRPDGRNLVEEARGLGYTYVESASRLDTVSALPVLGLFDADHVAFEIDRGAGDHPSLEQMTRKALGLLSKAPNGFFVMIEAGRIDHAGHDNDPAAHLREMLAYDEAMRVAVDFARKDGATLIVATSDHETGGLTVGRDGVYDWNPAALAGIVRSLEAMEPEIRAAASAASSVEVAVQAVLQIAGEAGYGPFSDPDAQALAEVVQTAWPGAGSVRTAVSTWLKHRASIQSGLGWTTGGHTAVDVPLYATGPGSAAFVGRVRADELGQRLAKALGLSLPGAAGASPSSGTSEGDDTP